MKARTENNIKDWIVFFLTGVIETAEKSVQTFEEILSTDKEYKALAQTMGSRSGNAIKLIETLYEQPITNAKRVSEIIGITQASAYSLLDQLERLGILKEFTGSKRGKRYILQKYFEIFTK